jgi:hypothetical protein
MMSRGGRQEPQALGGAVGSGVLAALAGVVIAIALSAVDLAPAVRWVAGGAAALLTALLLAQRAHRAGERPDPVLAAVTALALYVLLAAIALIVAAVLLGGALS